MNINNGNPNQQNKIKRKRKKKNELGNLPYKCGCGKEYKSYPALFTHIKFKHNSVEPKGTIRSRKSRGRPKVIYSIN